MGLRPRALLLSLFLESKLSCGHGVAPSGAPKPTEHKSGHTTLLSDTAVTLGKQPSRLMPSVAAALQGGGYHGQRHRVTEPMLNRDPCT